ncbi:DegQ family serine endoprotease [Candidatus Hepatincolaceae symbiont of Richtersius coronifer]
MLRSFFFLLFLFFGWLIYGPQVRAIGDYLKAEDNNKLKYTIAAVVSIYGVNLTGAKNIEIFMQAEDSNQDKDVSIGSGVIINKDALILTNYHVIAGKNTIKVVLSDGRIFKAKILVTDSNLDLALLTLETSLIDIIPVRIISSSKVAIGDKVLAIGNPFGIGISVTAGIISALPARNITSSDIGKLLQTDAAINPGNSGGALITPEGELIGINIAMLSNDKGFVGIGFAIPSDIVNLFIKRAIEGKKVKEYWLGISITNVSNEIAKKLGLALPKGVMVTDVYQGGPADRAKVKVGDVIIEFDKQEIKNSADLSLAVAMIDNTENKEIKIFRDKEILNIPIFASIPQENIISDKTFFKNGLLKGLTLANNSNEISYEINSLPSQKGVVIVELLNNSPLKKIANLQKGDFIIAINNYKINNMLKLKNILENTKNQSQFYILIKRGSSYIDVNIKL